MFVKETYNLKSVPLCLLHKKASRSEIKTMWSFDSDIHILDQLPIVA